MHYKYDFKTWTFLIFNISGFWVVGISSPPVKGTINIIPALLPLCLPLPLLFSLHMEASAVVSTKD